MAVHNIPITQSSGMHLTHIKAKDMAMWRFGLGEAYSYTDLKTEAIKQGLRRCHPDLGSNSWQWLEQPRTPLLFNPCWALKNLATLRQKYNLYHCSWKLSWYNAVHTHTHTHTHTCTHTQPTPHPTLTWNLSHQALQKDCHPSAHRGCWWCSGMLFPHWPAASLSP